MLAQERLFVLKKGPRCEGPVLYWMSRDQRARDNWALAAAQELALERKVPLVAAFCLAPSFLGATLRHYGFMLRGLEETAKELETLSIPFFLLRGEPEEEIPRFVTAHGMEAVFTDFDPLRIKQEWQRAVTERLSIPLYEVDSHNVVPCRKASDKREYGAYTIRPKIHRLLPRFLEEMPETVRHPFPWGGDVPAIDWSATLKSLRLDRSVGEVKDFVPGAAAGHIALERFLRERLSRYDGDRNDPTLAGQSNLSPWLHFGQLSPQRVALEASVSGAPEEDRKAFLEELVVRRELADNYCLHTPDYDSFSAFPEWAQKTLDEHRIDERQYLYSPEELEEGTTHDPLWNAAQRQMVFTGKMHGWLRMYWAKKILEWSPSPEEALASSIALNDRYELDGRDPCGYTGIAWSVGGVHDRAWPTHPVYGKIRYMNLNGARRKFDVDAFVESTRDLENEQGA